MDRRKTPIQILIIALISIAVALTSILLVFYTVNVIRDKFFPETSLNDAKQIEIVSKTIQNNKDYNEAFKQKLANEFIDIYNDNYNKVLKNAFQDQGYIIEFKQLSPIVKTPAVDAFHEFEFFKDKSVDDYDFYTFNMSFLSTKFGESGANVFITGPGEGIAFVGEEKHYIAQDEQPKVYYPVIVAIKKGESISDYKITACGLDPNTEDGTALKEYEIVPDFDAEKINGELKIGDAFRCKLNDGMVLHGVITSIEYEKTPFVGFSPKKNSNYRSTLARVFILYSVEGNSSDNLLFETNTILPMLKPYITSEYLITSPGGSNLDMDSDILIAHYLNDIGRFGSFSVNGSLVLAVEAFVKEDIWEAGTDTVGFGKDVFIHFGDFYINLKAVQQN